MTDPSRRAVALVTAPALIEEWLDPLGVSLATFRDEMSGGWMFNYAEALSTAEIHTVIVCFSRWVEQPESFEHRPTGSTIWMVPPGRRFERVQRWIGEPALEGARDPRSLARGTRRHLAPYGLTPVRPLRDILRRERCGAILSQDYDSQRFDVCLALGRLQRIPVFATFQGGFFPESLLTLKTRRLAMRAAAGIVVPAREELDRVREAYGVALDKVAQVPNPLDVSAWRALPRSEARAALDLPETARVAVTHGRVDINDKGLDVLLESWARVTGARPGKDLRLLIVGAGPDAGQIHDMIATGRYPGASLVDEFVVDHHVLRQYLSAADAYAFAGRYEGFPVAPTEAMACGLPLAATDARGIPDLFERGEESGGIVVPRDDVDALAGAIGRLLDDPALSEDLGRRARSRVEECCSLEAVGASLAAFFGAHGMA
ncbi:MAG: hypothetical protein QOE08_1402 [Thermoleophilaceae bacterium]|nr:hypothetical protein [Thermoleophilaceae bacterium]